jgi:3-oxoacyl-[acyl-carrier protein] reductase
MIRLDPNLLRVGAMTLAAGLGAYAVRGWDGVARGLAVAADLLVMVGPAVVAGLALAAALRVLVPPGVLARWMGAESGARGLLLASLAGREAFGRAAEVWEVANVMMFLASDYASYMVGEVLSVSSQQA